MAGREMTPEELNKRMMHADVIDGRAWEPYLKKQVLDRLAKLWDEQPALRLGQLIGNVYHSTDAGGCRQYYAEDFDLIKKLEEFYDDRDTSY
jgi:hypothetical protein